jgi:hypothetical protein
VTQITTFTAVTSLITYYPPIRAIFLRYKYFKATSDPQEVALQLWKREDEPSEPEWKGFYELAAACLSRNVADILEKTPMARWCVTPMDGKLTDRTTINENKLRVGLHFLEGRFLIVILYTGS